MNIPGFFIRRPVMTVLVTLAIVVFGAMAYRTLPVSDLPDVDLPTIKVEATLPGAGPETMASAVAAPLEQQFGNIAGIDSMSSSSVLNRTTITLQFNPERSLDGAAQDVQTAISTIIRRLPQDLPSPPTFSKTNPTEDPIMTLSVSSPVLPLSEVNEYAETILAQRISMVSGVAQALVVGSQKYAVRVQLDPLALAARGIAVDEVKTAVSNANVNMPMGSLMGRDQTLILQANGQLENAESYRQIVVAYRNGRAVRLTDLAQVVNSVQNDKSASWLNHDRAIGIYVMRQPGANTIAVCDAVKEVIAAVKAQMPATVNIDIPIDNSTTIRKSVGDVRSTLMLAVMLVVLVIFLFLRSLAATLISGVAMPIAILGTFAVMYFFGYSVDNLSLLALTLSVGFVVDDAIVMLENIVRYVEQGMPVREAALRGSREIGFTILSMTLSLVAVFIPILFMGGMLGRLLHEFAVTISAAILVSGFVSLTLTPMLCSRFLKPHARPGPGAVAKPATVDLFGRMVGTYDRSLQFAFRRRGLTLGIAVLTLALTIVLIIRIPKGFIPTEDNGRIGITVEAAQDSSFEAMKRHVDEVSAIIQRYPSVAFLNSSTGGYGGGTTNIARIYLTLVDRKHRPSAEAIVQKLRTDLAGIPGVRVFPQVPPAIRLGGRSSSSVYQFALYGGNLDELYKIAASFLEKFRAVPGIVDVGSDLQITSSQLVVDINRDRAAALGVTAQQIEDTMFSAFGSRQISTILTPTNQYIVILELEPRYQRDQAALAMLYLRSSSGRLVPLESVAHLRRSVGPLSVAHLGQTPAVTLTFNLAPGVALSQATDAINALARRELPATVSYTFQGNAAAFASSLKGLGWLLLMAVLVIYIVLGILYENFIHPVTILSGLPSACMGALVSLVLFREELNIYGYVGLIMLIGIVKKNAIMMIDFALEAQRTQGKSAAAAIHEACLVRFRPIMMTTLAALAGTLPIAIGLGAGADARRSLGIAVVGGLLVSQLLTLFITPIIYVALDGLVRRRASRVPAGAVPVPTH